MAFKRERKLRRRTNYYIISLAVADLLVGLIGIPCAILASVGLPKQFYACLFSVSLLVVLCTISIFSLVAVSVDRYWAILYPMSYSRNVTSKFALGELIFYTIGTSYIYSYYTLVYFDTWFQTIVDFPIWRNVVNDDDKAEWNYYRCYRLFKIHKLPLHGFNIIYRQ